MSREKPKKIKVSVGSRIFDTVNLIFLILLGLTTFYPFWDCLVVSFSSLKSYLATVSYTHLFREFAMKTKQYLNESKLALVIV